MPRFHLELTGYVGRENFNSAQTVRLLNQYPGKPVDVLIDSLGGSLAHGLSISDAFRNHGDVTAHLRGMCASAATIASMGAKKITIAPEAFYLVHKVMMSFFDWSTHNADSLQQYIEALTKQKEDLQTLDSSVAATYAARCKKPVNELLDLMKEGKWLTAGEALEWGFVDEITQADPKARNKLTKAQASMFEAQGLPIPPISIEPDDEPENFYSQFLKIFKSLFNMNNNNPQNQSQDPANQDPAKQQSNEIDQLKAQLEAEKKKAHDLQAKIDELQKEPGASTSDVLDSPEPKNDKSGNNDVFADFVKTSKSAKALFDSLP